MADLGEDQVDGMGSKKEEWTVVLSVFKGAHFVVKERPGHKCKLVAKLGELEGANLSEVLETGVVDLIPGQSEPNFNAQLAWSFHKKEIQRLRSDGKSLKLQCFLVKDNQELGDQIGYIVLPLKDAFFMNSVHEVDPTSAKQYSLLGTRDPWCIYHPKIRLHFHIEASTKSSPVTNRGTQKKEMKSSVTFRDQGARAAVNKFTAVGAIHALADPKKLISRMTPKLSGESCKMDAGTNTTTLEKKEDYNYKFGVNELGYFELGDLSNNDDLYIVSIIVVHASCFHLLEQLPTHVENYQWRVEYKSFGFDITSDLFKADNSAIKRGFIGDKATARIRANGADFFKYLSNASLEFRVFRIKPGSPAAEEVGQTCLGLFELTKPDLKEVKYDLEVISTVPYPVSANFLDQKPELRVSVELECMPGFFKNEWQISPNTTPLKESNKSAKAKAEEAVDQQISHEVVEIPIESSIEEVKIIENVKADESPNMPFTIKDWDDSNPSADSSKEIDTGRRFLPKREDVHAAIQQSNEGPPAPTRIGDSSIMEAGTYRITINFDELWLKSRSSIKEDFVLYYHYKPIGLVEDVECFATPEAAKHMERDERLKCNVISEGVWNITISLRRLSNNLLYKPLIVRVTPSKHYAEGNRRAPLGTCNIPFGKVFFLQEIDGKRQLKKQAKVMHAERQVNVGYLSYSIEVEMLEALRENSPLPSRLPLMKKSTEADYIHGKTPPKPTVTERGEDLVDGNRQTHSTGSLTISRKAEQQLEAWKIEQEHIFKAELAEKEKAYLRILSEEWQKRDADREAQIKDSFRSLQQRENEITKEKERIAKREESLKQLESDLKSSSQSSTLESRKQLETEKLRVRLAQENSRIETGLLQRQIQEYIAELEKKAGRILLLETKLREKEDEITKLIASRNRWSDMEQSRKLDQYTTQNEYLKQKLKETESQRDEYRRRISKLSGELEFMKKQKNLNLEAENENLRVQLLANQQRSDLANDRRSLKEVAAKIKDFHDMYEKKSKEGVESICTPDPKRYERNLERGDRNKNLSQDEISQEMKRLSGERARLLREGTYSKYDLVIRDLDSKLRNLGELPSRLSY